MRVLYFAYLRERMGQAEESLDTPAKTVTELVHFLRARNGEGALAFSDLGSLRVAVDQELADWDSPLSGAQEVAFFPPMTGG